MKCERDKCPEWESLPAEVKADVARLESAMDAIDEAENKFAKCKELARTSGGQRGWSQSRLRAKYYEWVNLGRTWTTLVDWAKVGSKRKTPRSMCDSLFKHYCGQHQRSSKKAHERMMSDLWRGKRLPGILAKGADGDWTDIFKACYPRMQVPAMCPFGWVPPGMSYRNMQHYAKLSKREIAMLRIGSKAAHKFTPPVFSTREGMQPGMLYQCDDVWHDIEVILPGINKGLARPLEFCCIDYASTNKVAYGMICQIEQDDGSKRSLREREMLWLICHLLTNIGYHKDGCVIVIEHGAATVRPHIRDKITSMTDGKVTFRTSEIIGKSLVKGMFDGAGKGNFKAKALVESSHRLLHYEAAYLPAQTGGNARVDRPEQLDGIESYAGNILKAWSTMSEDRRGLLWMPALTYWAYRPIVADLYRAIYTRTEHECEGWDANGWLVPEWSLSGIGDWQPVANIKHLPPTMRAVAETACKEHGHVRARRMSPLEVWDSGQDELERLPPWAAVEILGDKYCHRAAVQSNGLIEFMDRNIEPGKKFRFQSQVLSPAGQAFIMEPGQIVSIYALPHDLTKAVIADPESGAILGVAPAWNAVSPINAAQVKAAIAEQAKIVAAKDAPIKARHEEDGVIVASCRASNDYLLAEDAELVDTPRSSRALPKSSDVDLTKFFQPNFTNKNTKEGDPNEY
ncbi:MAG: hypothetical protein PHO37_17090 [Kiritimatiellae bacterium]|nr:hypothetical protein [Kiritimatiellia bacterium]